MPVMPVTQPEKNDMRKICIIISGIFFVAHLSGQTVEWIKGSVSYVSSANVYVKFASTDDIVEGDTLFTQVNGNWTAALLVKKKSSLSCITNPLSGMTNLAVGAEVGVKKKALIPADIPKVDAPAILPPGLLADTLAENVTADKKVRRPLVNGRFSASTNASIADGDNNYQRVRMALTMNVSQIGGSYFSTQNYITYRHRYGIDQQSGFYDDFKIYALALSYDRNGHSATFGRRINNRIANMGAIDGLQYEKKSGDFVTGLFLGSRPDFMNYTFNPNLLQRGLFFAHEHQTSGGMIQTSFAIVEQRNHSNTDRRFTYFQHSSTLGKNVNLFGSVELDLYQKVNEVITNKIKLTGAYFSVRYRPFRQLNLTASYDNRRNVIFYETNRTYIDQLLSQETRQGYRLQVGYNLLRSVNLSASAFYRYQENTATPTKNYVANINFSKLIMGLSAGLNANKLESYYFKGTIFGARLSKNVAKGQVNLEANYRMVNYTFFSGEQTLNQDIVGMSANINMTRLTTLILSYEGTFDATKNYHRYFVTAIQRFKNK
ncbi:MAG: hypothetical protein IPN29_17605 [Saprospiraceae bacterium]|nr:hypothetical protein [Saprospiraceae bacterium]